MTQSKYFICEVCELTTRRTGPVQRYCKSCSEKKDLERKKLWARGNNPSDNQRVRNLNTMKERKETAKEAGAERNKKTKQAITWYDPQAICLKWQIRIAIPFSYAMSKNHIYALRKIGHVALRKEGRLKRERIALEFRTALTKDGFRVAHNKLWIDILVQKPNHRGDAVNVIDLVCDGLKDGIGLDDRWFCIRRLDWEIAKEDPQIYIGIGQDNDKDCQVCSYCGQIKELFEFNKHKQNHLGIGRECKDCMRQGRILRKRQKEQEGRAS